MELKYFKKRSSDRLLEAGEVLELISSAGTGITTNTLQNLTANLLSKTLKKSVKNKEVKVKKTTAFSKNQSNIYYTQKKINTNRAKELELMSYAVWYMRNVGLKIGKVILAESGNIFASAALAKSSDAYVLLEFTALNQRNFQRKLASIKNVKGTQAVLVIEDTALLKQLKKSDLKGNIALLKTTKDNEIFLKAVYDNSQMINTDFDFTQLKIYKDKSEVERINTGYEQCKILREKNHLKK